MRPAKPLAQVRRNRCRLILKICGDASGVRRLPNEGRGLMQKRKFARERAGELSLPELLDRLERVLTGGSSLHLCLQKPVGSELPAQLSQPERCCTEQSINALRRRRRAAIESQP